MPHFKTEPFGLLSIFLAGICMTLYAHAAPLTIGVSTTPLSTPFYVADKLGYFSEEGLDVVLKDCKGGKLCMEQMLAGQVNLATAADLPIVFNSFSHKNFSVLGTFATSSRDVKLIALKSSGIKSIRDLPGKRVAVTRGSAAEYFINLTMLTSGLDPDSLHIVDMTADQMELTGKSGKVDAFVGFDPGIFKLTRSLKEAAFALDVPAIYTVTFNLVTQKSTVKNKEADLIKVLRALDKAIRFIQTTPEKAQIILQEKLSLDAAFMSNDWADYRFNLTLNQSLMTTLESEARWAIREKVVKAGNVPNFLDLVDPSLLRAVRPSAVTLVK